MISQWILILFVWLVPYSGQIKLINLYSSLLAPGYAPKPQRQFLSPELPSGGEQGEVLISYVHSPDSIYVQMVSVPVCS